MTHRCSINLKLVLPAIITGCGVLVSALAWSAPFVRGWVEGSRPSVVSAVLILRALFTPAAGLDCGDAADVDDDGRLGIGDAVNLLNYLFRAGPEPLPPFPACGDDSTADALGCTEFPWVGDGDGWFFVIDRSWSFDEQIPTARAEVVRQLMAFAESTHLGIVFVSQSVLRFPRNGLPALSTPDVKAMAVRFVETTQADSGSCHHLGLLTALEFAERSPVARDTITYLSDGEPACGGFELETYPAETLAAVRERNQAGVRIDTIGIGDLTPQGEAFLRQLAAENSGTYLRLPQ